MIKFKHGGSVAAALVLTATLAACGGGSSGSSSVVANAAGTPAGPPAGGGQSSRNITETDIAIPDSTMVLVASDPGGSSRADLSAATYQIMLFWQSTTGQSFNELLGTGFAVGGDLIATNAHVSGEILNRARNYIQSGFSLTKASAFRAETGEEVPLLEALVHPSYDGSVRSPDIGLFVARSGLPVALELATNLEIAAVRAGSQINLNGFPGDVHDLIFSRSPFTPGLSIPQATLFTGNIQSLQKFDERSVIDQNNPQSIDMIQHSMDTSGGTSGSPILADGKVIGVHNSGLQRTAFVVGADGTPQPQVITQATASWGIHVKHLRNLLAEYNTGVLEADKRYRLPPEPALLNVGGQSTATPIAGTPADANGNPGADPVNNDFVPVAGVVAPNTARTITGSLSTSIVDGGIANHSININIDQSLNVSGASFWPSDQGGQIEFILSGFVDNTGYIEFVDNTPEVIPGFRRGIYLGNINPASGSVIGEYYEIDDFDNIFYFGDWQGQLQ